MRCKFYDADTRTLHADVVWFPETYKGDEMWSLTLEFAADFRHIAGGKLQCYRDYHDTTRQFGEKAHAKFRFGKGRKHCSTARARDRLSFSWLRIRTWTEALWEAAARTEAACPSSHPPHRHARPRRRHPS